MPIQVWDYRKDVQNLVASPEIRARFNRIDPNDPPQFHSHDLGGEIFLVLDGEITFDVEGEVVTCQPGQAIYVPPHLKHRVYNQGDRPASYYLSVTPHVEPTHTHYDEKLERKAPSYGGWRGAGNPAPEDPRSTAELATALADEAENLARQATSTAHSLRQQAEVLKAASASSDSARLKQAADAVWEAAYPTLRQVRQLERTWNELAPRTMGS